MPGCASRARRSTSANNPGVVALPTAPEDGGDWVVIDNFRVGIDLLKNDARAVVIRRLRKRRRRPVIFGGW